MTLREQVMERLRERFDNPIAAFDLWFRLMKLAEDTTQPATIRVEALAQAKAMTGN